jgi:phage terminase large subunit
MSTTVDIDTTWIGTVCYGWMRDPQVPVMIQRGGTRSGKTFNACLAWAAYLDGPGAGERLSIVRKTNPALKATVWADMLEVLRMLDLYDVRRHNKTEQEVELPSGAVIDYFGIDDDLKVHGRKRDHLWANEATELPRNTWDQLIMRTTGLKMLDFNPSVTGDHWIYDRYEGSEQAVWYRSTYKDNPHLTDEQVRVIESYKHTDPWKWSVYGLGRKATPAGAIYTDVHAMQGRWDDTGGSVIGIDWGYNDPMAVARVQRRDREGKPALEVYALLHESYLTTDDLIERLPDLGITKQDRIICDSAEPDRIEKLQRAGYNAMPSKKGAGSVNAGIDTLKEHSIKIGGPEQSAFLREFRQYRWKTDHRSGEATDTPQDGEDHAPDAVRYAVTTAIMGRRSTGVASVPR